MAERPRVAGILTTLANYNVAIPSVEEQPEGKEGKAAPKVSFFMFSNLIIDNQL